MQTGDIILIPFPFSELTNIKVRPAVIVCLTKDKYKDIVLAAISSQVPSALSLNEMVISPSSLNNLRAISVIKIDRVFTLKNENKIADLGKLTIAEINLFKQKFKALVD